MHSTVALSACRIRGTGYAQGLSWLRATRGQRAGANREGKGWQRAGPSWVWMIDCGEAHGNGPTAPNPPNWPGWPGWPNWLKLGPIWTCMPTEWTSARRRSWIVGITAMGCTLVLGVISH